MPYTPTLAPHFQLPAAIFGPHHDGAIPVTQPNWKYKVGVAPLSSEQRSPRYLPTEDPPKPLDNNNDDAESVTVAEYLERSRTSVMGITGLASQQADETLESGPLLQLQHQPTLLDRLVTMGSIALKLSLKASGLDALECLAPGIVTKG